MPEKSHTKTHISDVMKHELSGRTSVSHQRLNGVDTALKGSVGSPHFRGPDLVTQPLSFRSHKPSDAGTRQGRQKSHNDRKPTESLLKNNFWRKRGLIPLNPTLGPRPSAPPCLQGMRGKAVCVCVCVFVKMYVRLYDYMIYYV